MALGCKADSSAIIIMEFITDDLQGFIDSYNNGEADTVKTNKNIQRLNVNKIQQMALILNKGF
jgi:hypothetical protein